LATAGSTACVALCTGVEDVVCVGAAVGGLVAGAASVLVAVDACVVALHAASATDAASTAAYGIRRRADALGVVMSVP
jgi:hypothetical protein